MATLQELQNDITAIFGKIEVAKSIEELKAIQNLKEFPYLKEFDIDERKYPRLDISLTIEEVKSLKKEGLLEPNGSISLNLAKNNALSPLEKLLFSILWKNTDLGKEKHIIEGVIGRDDKKDSLVFYYFGVNMATYRSKNICFEFFVRCHS